MLSSTGLVIACLSVAIRYVAAASEASHVLWYSRPAQVDFFDALPIGNGRLGAMIHGYVDQELVRLNEESIWSGGPLDKIPPTALENLGPLRQQILGGNLTEAGETWAAHFRPEYDDMRRYQPAGQLHIEFPHVLNGTTGYRRLLDISSGIASTTYTYMGITYSREALANSPHGVLALRISASRTAALSFNMSLARDQNVTELTVDEPFGTILLRGTGEEDDTYRFTSKARLVLSGGSLSSNGTSLHVYGADEAWIFYDAETAHRYVDATIKQLDAAVDSRLAAAMEIGYDALSTESVVDYQEYYNRTSVDLGTSGDIGKQDVAARLSAWKSGDNVASDPELMALQFNYGKYLLIQSSRTGTLPANLQGIWNRDFVPPWDSKFTININLEMNYWLAQPLNLAEIAEPVVDLLDRLAVTGRVVAKGMYGAEGWCCHHNTDITGDCTPYHGLTIAAPYPLGGAWLAFEAIEHFRFTGDKDFARDRVLPILKGVMDFIYTWATEREGRYITNPSCSPENSYVIPEDMTEAGNTTGLDAGAMNDRAIMWEIMTGYVEISDALNLTEGVERASAFRAKIQPPETGSYGQLLEYSREFEENDPGHRHFSPLVGAHPGTWISPLATPGYADAAYRLLRHRMDLGGGGNSWSVTWASLLHARLLDAPRALEYAAQLLARWTHPNLLSRNGGYFQIDGNSGFTAAVVEMFLQSHAGLVHLGPAIPPSGIASGEFKGWIARGGFRVDMAWADGKVASAEVTSLLGNVLKLRVGGGEAFRVDGGELQEGAEGIRTRRGQKVSITTA